MNKKICFVGMLASVLTLGVLFAACENGVQEVEGNVNATQVVVKAAGVASVTALQTTTPKDYIIVSFDAVENASSYTLYRQQDGKKSINTGGSVGNNSTYNATTGVETYSNSDVDKWSGRVYVSSLPVTTIGTKYRFGIQTQDLSYNRSDIVWSDLVTLQ
jgi:hypothetical protein